MTREEFDAAVSKHYKTLRKTLVKNSNISWEESEEVVQRGLKELLEKEKYREFEGKSKVLTWLVGCLKLTARQWRREQSRRRDRGVLSEERNPKRPKIEESATQEPSDDPARGDSPEGDKLVTRNILQGHLATLPEQVQYVARRVYVEGASWEEVAAELKVEVRSLQRRVVRYLASLREDRGSRGKGQRQAGAAPKDMLGYMELAGLISLDGSPIERIEVPFSQKTIGQIRSWTKDWDIEKLLDVFERDPEAIAHPVVRLYTHRLRDIAHGLPLILKGVLSSFMPHLPTSSSEALETLTRLGEAWVRGLFPDGWTVKITPPKGSPRRMGKFDEWMLLVRFNTIYRGINHHPDTPLLFGVQTSDADTLVERVARIAQRVGQQKMQRDANRRIKITPMPMKKAREIALRAVRRNKASKRLLALSVLAHETGKTLKAVESLISRAEATAPEFDRRRLSRQPS